MSPALRRGLAKAGRTLLQVVAAGGLTALVDALAEDLDPTAQLAIAAGWLLVVTFAQNTLETAGKLPVLLPSPGLVTDTAGGAVTTAVGTVDAVVEAPGRVVGPVLDTAGRVVGGVTGAVGGLLGGPGDDSAPGS